MLLAIAIALAHGLLAVFLIVGAPPAARSPRLMRWYLAMLVPTGLVNLAGLPCPLTVWEKHFWRLGSETPYRGGFISHYFVEPFYAPGLRPGDETLLLVAVVVWCLLWLLYSAVWHLRLRPGSGSILQSNPRPALDLDMSDKRRCIELAVEVPNHPRPPDSRTVALTPHD